MSGNDAKSPVKSPAQAARDARLAKALRDNLRRRKAPSSPAPEAEPDPPKAD